MDKRPLGRSDREGIKASLEQRRESGLNCSKGVWTCTLYDGAAHELAVGNAERVEGHKPGQNEIPRVLPEVLWQSSNKEITLG